ncbi:hypothetical protein LZD49_26370 [Dyadobacter sp. CY261]|uniref:hypothetical protein n=1 Tax=Dyadobacter sp. CY261 TaxID=2907203 RepID=UPI001F3AEE5A|nr:hypothetical protein [Dyadobacter sp. CY261]MCF0074035.1 hypothetical protein [Dyadobacter sp. CY261]
MKTYKVINRFSDRLDNFTIREVGEELKLANARGEELTEGGFVELIEESTEPVAPATTDDKPAKAAKPAATVTKEEKSA